MSTVAKPLRAAFWSLLIACGLMTAASVSDPHRTHLALNAPPPEPPPISVEPLSPELLIDLAPQTMLADDSAAPQPPTGDEAFDTDWAIPDPSPENAVPRVPLLADASPQPTRAIAVPPPAAVEIPMPPGRPAVAEPIRVATSSGRLNIALDETDRPPGPSAGPLSSGSLASGPLTSGAGKPDLPAPRIAAQPRPVPMPVELPSLPPEDLATSERSAHDAGSPFFPTPAASDDAVRAKRPTAPRPQLTPGLAAADRIADPVPAARAAVDADPVLVAQLDILDQLKDLQKATQKRNATIDRVSKQRRAGGSSGADGFDPLDPLAEEAEPVPEPILEYESAGFGSDGAETFRLQIADAPIAQVLEMIGDLGEMNILSAGSIDAVVNNNFYDVTVEEALDALARTYDLEYERNGKFVHVTTRTAADARRAAARKTVSKVYRPGFVAVADLAEVVSPLLTPNVGVLSVTTPAEIGIEADNTKAGGDSLSQPDALVVIDYAERIEEIDRLVAQMDTPPPQVAIDAVIMQVRLNDQLNLGVNLAFAGDGNNDLLVSGNGAAIRNSAGFPLPSVAGTGAGGADATAGPAQEIIEPLGRLAASQAGLSFGYLRGDFSALFEALEEITDVSLVASPHVQVVNKQKAEIIIGERLGYRTLGFNDTQTIENVQFLDAGTKLLLRPFVGPGGLIRLEVHPERSSAQIDAITGLPQQQTTEVTTNVMVRDGQTLVIGGLIEEQVVKSEKQVPLLGSIPLLGRAFQNSAEQVLRTELIVLLTPRLVTEARAIESAGIGAEFARRAETFHDTLTPIARDQLAALHRRHAEEALARGDLPEAYEHVHKALQIDPTDLQTLRLRDQIAPNW